MNGFEFIIVLIAFFWGILNLILFFKIWGMTNDVDILTKEVHRLTAKICQDQQPNISEKADKFNNDLQLDASEILDHTTHDFKAGDEVFVISTKKKVKVIKYEEDNIFCDCGFVAGYKWFNASELTRCIKY